MHAEALLPREFYDRAVLDVARGLLGCVVEHSTEEGVVSVRLAEVEAYDGEQDPGSHAFRGRTKRNAVMFGPPGHVYVYFTYGMHWCMNLVCGPVGTAAAVLLRGGQVVAGVDVARRRRISATSLRDLARGPARLTQALGVDGRFDGTDVVTPHGPIRVLAGSAEQRDVRTGPRVGVAGEGAHHPWRFWLDAEPTVSAYRPAISRRGPRPASGTLGIAADAESVSVHAARPPVDQSATKGAARDAHG